MKISEINLSLSVCNDN